MIWLERVLSVIACGSAAISTLRAGSRACYILEHDAIGAMDGPMILPPGTGESDQSWELVNIFQQSVRLALELNGSTGHSFPTSISKKREQAKATLDSSSPYRLKKIDNSITSYSNTISSQKVKKIDQNVSENTNKKEADRTTNKNLRKDHESKKNKKTKTQLTSWSWRDEILGIPTPKSRLKSTALENEKSARASQSWNLFQNTKNLTKKLISRRSSPSVVIQKEATTNDQFNNEGWDFDSILSTEIDTASFRSADDNYPKGRRIAKISAYAPNCFTELRAKFQVSETLYEKSILLSGPYISFQSNSKGAARAGGAFFFTRDGAYMIKTIKKDEVETFLKCFPKYFKYMRRNCRRSLLTRFCGMYQVKLSGSGTSTKDDEYTFIVMNSVFPAEASKFMSERYDLKGSTVGRECSKEEKKSKGSNAVLKDLNLAREVQLIKQFSEQQSMDNCNPLRVTTSPREGYGICIGSVAKSELMNQLRKDLALLVDCKVMDYSLLVGVVKTGNKDYDNSKEYLNCSPLKQKKKGIIVTMLSGPIRALIAPPVYISKKVWLFAHRTASTIMTIPLPYYGSGKCGLYGGKLSKLDGYRAGDRAIYYLGLIDFLQPWTTKKAVERQLKGVLFHDMKAISCVPPEEYASRFLDFIDKHVS